MLSCVASTSFAAKVRLVSFIPSTSWVPFRKKESGQSRPAGRSQWMAGRKKKRRKNGQHQPLGVNWSDCTWCSETPCWCAWLPFLSFLNSTWQRKTLTPSMIGSMDQSWGAVGLPLRSRRCSWQSAMHGERFMSWCMVACISKKLSTRSKTTVCSGWEKSWTSHLPTSKREIQERQGQEGLMGVPHPPTSMGEERKGPRRQRRQRKREDKVFVPFCRDYFIKKTCQGQCGRSHNCPVGSVMQDPKPENCPHKAWKDRTAADGAVWKPRGRQHPPAGRRHIVSTHGWWWRSIRDWGFPRYPKDCGSKCFQSFPANGCWWRCDPKEDRSTPIRDWGSPDIPNTVGPNVSNLALGKAANGAVTHAKRARPAEPAASQFGKSAKNSNLTAVVRNSVKPIPGWDMFQIDWGTGFYLQWPKGAFNPGPILVLLYAGKDDPLSLDSCLHAHYPRLSPHVVAFDIRRSPQPLGHDLLDDQLYGKFCQAAIEGRVRLVCGGPNCRTWSILRWFPKPNAPVPVRGRSEDQCGDFPLLPHWSRKR